MRVGFWDRLGLGVSGLCVVHCLLFPVVLAILPIWPMAYELHAWLHPAFAALLIPTTIFAARIGFRRHADRRIVALLIVGIVTISFAAVLGHDTPGAKVESLLTMAGSFLLIGGHAINWRVLNASRLKPA